MVSLDKLASMEGWDLGEDEPGDSEGILGKPLATTTPQCISKDPASIGESGEGQEDRVQRAREMSTAVSRLDHESVAREEQKRISQEGSLHHDSSGESSGDGHTSALHHGSDIDNEAGDGQDATSNSTFEDMDNFSVPPLHPHTSSCNGDFGVLRKSSFLPPPKSRAFIQLFSQHKDEAATPINGDCVSVLPNAAGNESFCSEDNHSQILLHHNDAQRRETADHLSKEEGMSPDKTNVAIMPSSSSRCHPLEALRKKAEGTRNSPRNGTGTHRGDTAHADRYNTKVASCGSNQDKIINVDKLKALLRREREHRAREREGREVAEREAKIALDSLEVKARRTLELENRIRVLAMRVNLSNATKHKEPHKDEYPRGRRGRGTSAQWTGGTRSLSPERWTTKRTVLRGAWGSRVGSETELAERRVQMRVVADAAHTAREEARAALDSMDGFAALNRKLIEELRAVVRIRDDLLEDLCRERRCREELEGEVNQLLGGGLAAAFKEKEDELEERCERERKETKRITALHTRMEDEYRLTLMSLGRDRERLEGVVASLKGYLVDARHDREVRAKEEEERANMNAEEVASIRAGFAPRPKRRVGGDGHRGVSSTGYIHSNLNSSKYNNIANTVKVSRASNGCSTAPTDSATASRATGSRPRRKEIGWLEVQRRRVESQRIAAERVAIAVAEGRSNAKRIKSQPTSSPDHGGHNTAVSGGALIQKDHNAHSNGDHLSHHGGGGVSGGRRSGPRGGGSSVGGGDHGGGTASVIVQRVAVEIIEMFVGDFVPTPRPPPPEEWVASDVASGGNGGQNTVKAVSKPSKWAAIGRAGKLSTRAAAVCAQEAQIAAETEAHNLLRATIKSAARALSTAFFSILENVAAFAANLHVSAAEATIPGVAVRRLVQICGMLRSTAGGPTLGHVDVELQKNPMGRGRVGHREFFMVILSLAELRFAGEPRDDALEKLSRMLKQHSPRQIPPSGTQSAGGAAQHERPKTVLALKKHAAGSGPNAPTADGGSAGEFLSAECLMGAERVLERDRRALEAIFYHYTGAYSAAPDVGGSRTRPLLRFVALAAFCKDFELTPGLVSREDAHRIYAQLAYPHETMLTPRAVASREGSCRSNTSGTMAMGSGTGPMAAAGLGLNLRQWMAWLGLAAVGCPWFETQRGLYNSSTKKMLGLLQWMEGSAGKSRISARRGAGILPAFNLLHPGGVGGGARR